MNALEKATMYGQLDVQRAELAMETAEIAKNPKKRGKANTTATTTSSGHTGTETLQRVGHAFKRCPDCDDLFKNHSDGKYNPNFRTNPRMLAKSQATREKWQAHFPPYDPTGAAQMALEGVKHFVPVRVGSRSTAAAHAAAQTAASTSSTSANTTPVVTTSTSVTNDNVESTLKAIKANVTALTDSMQKQQQQNRAMLSFFENLRDDAHAAHVMENLFRESSDDAPGRGHATFRPQVLLEPM